MAVVGRRACSYRSAAPMILAVVAVLASGCAAAPPNGAPQRPDQGFIAGDGSITLLPAAERQQAPDISGTTLTGDPWSLASQRGTIIVFNVWGSWCAPCRAEAPVLKKVSEMYQGQKVAFIGINTRDSRVPALAFEKEFGITYPSLEDQDGQLQLRFAGTLPPSAIPSTVIIDRHGRVAGRIIGRTSESTLRGLIEPLLAEDSPATAPTPIG